MFYMTLYMYYYSMYYYSRRTESQHVRIAPGAAAETEVAVRVGDCEAGRVRQGRQAQPQHHVVGHRVHLDQLWEQADVIAAVGVVGFIYAERTASYGNIMQAGRLNNTICQCEA